MYEEMVLTSFDYIEDHIGEEISLQIMAERNNISVFHFSRIFSFMTGDTFKGYVKKRKVSHSLAMLDSNMSVIDTAFNCGFSHPESFTRTFRAMFDMSPREYKANKGSVKPFDIGSVIGRDLVNFRGELLLRADYVYLNEKRLYSERHERSILEKGWFDEISSLGEKFIRKICFSKNEKPRFQYHFATCLNGGNFFEFRFCIEADDQKQLCPDSLEFCLLEAGWYVQFRYEGNLSEIFDSLDSDIKKWVSRKDPDLRIVSKGLVIRYDRENDNVFDVFIKLSRKSNS